MAKSFSVEKRIFSRLSSSAAVYGLVKNRIYPDALPHKPTYPAITYQLVSSEFEHAFGSDPGNITSRYQVTFWDKTHSGAVAGREAVEEALSRYRTATGAPTISDTFQEGQNNFLDDGRDQEAIHRAISDFVFFYEAVTVYYPVVSGDNVTGVTLMDTGYRFLATGDTIIGTTSAATGWVFVSRGQTDTVSRLEVIDG